MRGRQLVAVYKMCNVPNASELDSYERKVGMSGYASEQSHYVAFTPIQVMQQLMNRDEFQGFCKGNAIKYILRANYKGQHDSDIQKARQYMWWSEIAKTGKLIDPATDIPPEDWEPSIL